LFSHSVSSASKRRVWPEGSRGMAWDGELTAEL
jgi:hypothetical protein